MHQDTEDAVTANWLKEVMKGYIRIGILILLNKKSAHGYEIMKEIRARTGGMWHPTAGGVYPILRDLEESGYVDGEWQTQRNRRLKVYRITESGSLILKHAFIKQAEIYNNIGMLFREFARDVLAVELKNTPDIPSFFSPFLEENSQDQKSLRDLEHQRRHLQELQKTTSKKLRLIEKQIAKAKKKLI